MALRKIVKAKGAGEPDEFEQSVSNALLELENGEYKAELRPLHITSAREIDAGNGKRAVLISVPVPQLKSYQKIANKLIRELEKKFAGKHVIIIAQRRILKKPSRTRSAKQPRPRSRTLTAVHEAILEDLVFPSEIVGKRTRVKTDNTKLTKVFLDRKDQTALEHKLDTFSSVYKNLTGIDVVFEFPPAPSAE